MVVSVVLCGYLCPSGCSWDWSGRAWRRSCEQSCALTMGASRRTTEPTLCPRPDSGSPVHQAGVQLLVGGMLGRTSIGLVLIPVRVYVHGAAKTGGAEEPTVSGTMTMSSQR